jgi:hypothetical protein
MSHGEERQEDGQDRHLEREELISVFPNLVFRNAGGSRVRRSREATGRTQYA